MMTRPSKRAWTWVGLTMALMTGACGGPSPGEGESSEEVETLTSDLKNANLFNGGTSWRGVVKLEIFWESQNMWMKCTGQVVSRQTILTAAHCMNFLGSNPAMARVKAWKQVSATGFQTVVRDVYSHLRYNPAYDQATAKYDVGLITVPSVQPLTNVVSSDAAMLATDAPSGTNMMALGFGYYGNSDTEIDGKGRSALIVPTYSTSALDYQFTNPNTKLEVCHGDSGGPLKGIAGHLLQYGVASMGTGHGDGHCRNTSHWAALKNNISWIKGKITGTCTEGPGYLCW